MRRRLVALSRLALAPLEAADEPPAPTSRWSNQTELSLVATEGNSSQFTVSFKNTLEHKTERGRTRFRVDAMRLDESDDPYRLVEPGLTFPPGAEPSDIDTIEVRPGAEPENERYFVEGRYEGTVRKSVTWNSGASWNRDEDAGIINRYIVFGGLGRTWVDREDLAFRTSYGLSLTDREEEIDDPQKEQRFLGARLAWDFKDTWGKATTYDNDFTFNLNLEDTSDFNVDWVQGLAVAMNKWLSLKVSLQFLYASEPALEEVDLVAFVQLIDPDGIAGSGDEFFETVETGGVELTLGEDTIRFRELDTTFRTSLLIDF